MSGGGFVLDYLAVGSKENWMALVEETFRSNVEVTETGARVFVSKMSDCVINRAVSHKEGSSSKQKRSEYAYGVKKHS